MVLAEAGNKVLEEVTVNISPRLTLTATAVATVLRGMLSGAHSPEEAQQWASFVRHGYFAEPGRGPVNPLDIDFEASADQSIADAIGRLDEIGDLIDGEVTTEEIYQLLAALGESKR